MFAWILQYVLIGASFQKSLNQELTEVLLSRIASGLRPVSDPKAQVQVHMLGALYQIVDVDQRNNLATINAYFDMWWKDRYLEWDPMEFNETYSTYLPANKVWIPELYLYHSIQGSTPLFLQESAVQVDHTGKVRTFVPFTARALCPINVKYFPFDNQSCKLTFGSWSYRQENVEYFVESEEVFLQDFYDNQEWILDSARLGKTTIDYYTDKHNETYSAVVMEMKMTRQSFYYVFNLVIPTTLVSVVAVVGFHAPGNSSPQRETKFRLGIMTLLSMGVMLLMVVDEMPKFSLASIPGQRGSFSDVPLLGIYYIFLICSISLCTCTTSLFVVLERYGLQNPDPKSIPRCFRWLSHEWKWRRKSSEEPTAEKALLNPPLNNAQEGVVDRNLRKPEEVMLKRMGLGTNHLTRSPQLGPVETESQLVRSLLERMAESLMDVSRQLYETRERMDEMALQRDRRRDSRHLTRGWHLLVNRLENLSLTVYLSATVVMLYMLFHPVWY